MHHTNVSSSFIESIGHDPDKNTMEVKFKNGKTFTHENVTEEQYHEFLGAESIGKHYNQNFRQ